MSYEGAQRLIETGMIYELGEAIGRAIAESSPEQPTLRDRFAMAALQGMIARGQDSIIQAITAMDFAEDAYDCADAMLRVRDRAPGRDTVGVVAMRLRGMAKGKGGTTGAELTQLADWLTGKEAP